MKRFLAVLGLLILSFPVVAANYDMLRENVSAAMQEAQNSTWKQIKVGDQLFIFDSASVEYGKKYELKYVESHARETGWEAEVIYVRYYPNVRELETPWTTDENLVKYEVNAAEQKAQEDLPALPLKKADESADPAAQQASDIPMYANTPARATPRMMMLVQFGNKSVSALRQLAPADENGGMVEVKYTDNRITRDTQIGDRDELSDKLLATVSAVHMPSPQEIKDRTLAFRQSK